MEGRVISFGSYIQSALVKKDAILCCASERQVLRLFQCEKEGNVGNLVLRVTV